MSKGKQSDQKKLKELTKLVEQFQEENPLLNPIKKPNTIEVQTNPEFSVIESSHTRTYSEKGWDQYGKLVGYSQGN